MQEDFPRNGAAAQRVSTAFLCAAAPLREKKFFQRTI
jgi:hypothetical protein